MAAGKCLYCYSFVANLATFIFKHPRYTMFCLAARIANNTLLPGKFLKKSCSCIYYNSFWTISNFPRTPLNNLSPSEPIVDDEFSR